MYGADARTALGRDLRPYLPQTALRMEGQPQPSEGRDEVMAACADAFVKLLLLILARRCAKLFAEYGAEIF
jgi:hypothetical protein